MKPLELNVYPAGGCFTSSDCELKQWCVECVEEVDKRFTDAELAAEYWESMYDAEVCSGWASDYSTIKQSRDRLATMRRFATLPHYDKPTP